MFIICSVVLTFRCGVQAFDFGNNDGVLATPSDYDSMMYAPAYDAGARVFSNSWGSVGTPTCTYT